jgi:isopenicillin N synthase-like dioxygenase
MVYSVKNSGVDEAVVDQTFEISKAFFKASAEVKKSVS